MHTHGRIHEHIGHVFKCRLLYTEVDGSNPVITMLCPPAAHFIRIASVDPAVKCVSCGDTLVKGVQCYELFGRVALKNHAFSKLTKRDNAKLFMGYTFTAKHTYRT